MHSIKAPGTTKSVLQVEEVGAATTWVMNNIEQYGGDPQRVSLFGHSAGAHLALMALLHRTRAASHQNADARMPQTAVLAAGVYDIQWHYEYEAARAVHRLSTMERCMGGWHRCRARSPSLLVQSALAHAHTGSAAATTCRGCFRTQQWRKATCLSALASRRLRIMATMQQQQQQQRCSRRLACRWHLLLSLCPVQRAG